MTAPRRADVERFKDIAESIGASVEIGTHRCKFGEVLGECQHPKVITRIGDRAHVTLAPTYRQCFARATEWLEQQPEAQ